MGKLVKDRMVKELTKRYQNVTNCLVVNYRGLNALQASNLRNYLRGNNIRINVIKNSVGRFTFKEFGIDRDVSKFMDGPSALIFSEPKSKADDPITLSKSVVTWREKNPAEAKVLLIRGGYLDGRLVETEIVVQFSRLPSREILLSQLAGAFNAPLSRLAFVLNNLPQKLAYGLKALVDKKPADEQPKASAVEQPKAPAVEQPKAAAVEQPKAPIVESPKESKESQESTKS